MEDALPALREFAKLLGVIFKPGKTKHNKLIEEQIKIVDQMNKKYKELNKTLSKTESLQGAFAAYKDAFADAYGRKNITEDTIWAVMYAFEIEDTTEGALFFHSNNKTNTFNGANYIFTDSCGHHFYK